MSTVTEAVLPDAAALAVAAADWFTARIGSAREGRIAICLTGGSTPEAMYRLLAVRDLPWARMHFFWGDERFVPADDPRSNFGMARRSLLDGVPVPTANIHPVPTGVNSPDEGAALYEESLKAFYGSGELNPARPLFDIVLLGMGGDGHMASLFPGAPALDETSQWAIASEPGLEPFVPRVTLTFPALESCRAAAFLVSGASKAAALARVRAGENLPAGRFRPQGPLTWLVDRAAAGEG